jgi:NADH-quinone oxidoreductase subunit M
MLALTEGGSSSLLTWMTFFPLIGAAIITALPGKAKQLHRWVALAASAVPLVMAVPLYLAFDRTTKDIQFWTQVDWISAFNIQYFVGIDGISISMVLLTAFLSFLCIIASWKIEKATKGYFALFLLLETGMLGVFIALDFFLFYVFWEVMLLPMYFLIGIWGGPRKEYAAIKFFLYTLAGSVLMLLVMIALYFNVTDPNTGGHTFNLLHMMNQGMHQGDMLATPYLRHILFLGLFIGFAIKVPIVPFHTWLPDAHVEAPTAVSVILAGVLLKMGTYGILRICYPILPDAARWFAWPLAILGAINIVYGAMCALAQTDMKKLVAYSSVSHMGYVLLGMAVFNEAGITGAVLQMFNHGTITAMLFLMVGVIYDRAHHREIAGFGGLGLVMPKYTTVFSLALFAALGLPGLSGFVGEALVFVGAFTVYKTVTIISAIGIVLGAAYVLWMLQRVFLGPLNEKYKDLPDISARELVTVLPIAALVILLGVYPSPLIDLVKTSLLNLIAQIPG